MGGPLAGICLGGGHGDRIESVRIVVLNCWLWGKMLLDKSNNEMNIQRNNAVEMVL